MTDVEALITDIIVILRDKAPADPITISAGYMQIALNHIAALQERAEKAEAERDAAKVEARLAWSSDEHQAVWADLRARAEAAELRLKIYEEEDARINAEWTASKILDSLILTSATSAPPAAGLQPATQREAKMEITDEMVEAFGLVYWPVNAASKIDAQREAIRAALAAALSSLPHPQEAVARATEEVNRPINPRHFEILAEAMAEVKATSDGLSDQPIADIVAGCLAEIRALPASPALAAQTADAVPVAIKPLEWENSICHSWHHYAKTIVGIYTISENGPEEFYIDLDGNSDGFGGRRKSLEAAKAAAQADYERRIRSALVDAPAEITASQDSLIADELTLALAAGADVTTVAGDGKPYITIRMNTLDDIYRLYDALVKFSSLRRSLSYPQPAAIRALAEKEE